MRPFFRLLRPHQWVKNLFILLPVFFSGNFLNWEALYPTITLFFAFCFISSSIYCFNDIWDIEADKLHPQKKNRPIASGKVSIKNGYLLMSLCFILAFSLLFVTKINFSIFLILIFYFLMNIMYCIKLKQVTLVDVFIISLGFVLRVVAGGLVSDTWVSEWIILMTFLLALFISFAKRRDDFIIYEKKGIIARKNIVKYNFEFLNTALIITATITIIAYIMYTMSPEVIERFNNAYLYVTSLFVLIGMLRYLQLTFVRQQSGSPTQILLKDRYIQLCIICWIGMFGFIVYIV